MDRISVEMTLLVLSFVSFLLSIGGISRKRFNTLALGMAFGVAALILVFS